MEKTVDQIRRKKRRDEKRAVELLKNLVSFINEGNSASRRVWDILTALRGPDNGSSALKDATTARLRYTLGLQEDKGNGFRIVKQPMLAPKFAIFAHKEAVEWHFSYHYNEAYRALVALGLLVEEKKNEN